MSWPDRVLAAVAVPAVGLGLGAVGFALALEVAPGRAFASLLLNGFFFISLALGALLFLALQYLVKAGWWVALQRVPEALTAPLPWLALLLPVVFLGRHDLYHWSHTEAVAHDPVLASKAAYFTPVFFLARMLVAIAIWSLFVVLFRRATRAQGDRPEGERSLRRLRLYSSLFLVLFAVSFTVAAVDWLMSLEPHWFSTIFAIYSFAGVFLAGMAAQVVAVLLLRSALGTSLRAEHLHDLGKLLFAFSCLWAYLWLSQYLLIWYANIPEEATHYATRTAGAWLPLFILNPVLNWALPFLLLLPRATKRNPAVLFTVALIVLLGRWLDLYLQVMPSVVATPTLGAPELLPLIGLGALFVHLTRRALARSPLEPRWHPLHGESLSYESR